MSGMTKKRKAKCNKSSNCPWHGKFPSKWVLAGHDHMGNEVLWMRNIECFKVETKVQRLPQP